MDEPQDSARSINVLTHNGLRYRSLPYGAQPSSRGETPNSLIKSSIQAHRYHQSSPMAEAIHTRTSDEILQVPPPSPSYASSSYDQKLDATQPEPGSLLANIRVLILEYVKDEPLLARPVSAHRPESHVSGKSHKFILIIRYHLPFKRCGNAVPSRYRSIQHHT